MHQRGRGGASRALTVALALAAGGLAASPGTAHAVTETYTFHDTLTPVEGAGNTLVPVYNGTGAILTSSAAGFVNGGFVTQNISASACASSPRVRSWSFPARGGLRYPNASPTLVTGSYTVSMLVRFSPLTGSWTRLLDFSNSTQDSGIYRHLTGVGFYPVGDFATGTFSDNVDTFVTITRDAASRLVSLYINGNPAGTYTDSGNLYAPAATVLYLFMDNTTGPATGESNPGVVSYLQVADTPLTGAQVAASLASICGSIACGNGVLEAGEGCDSGVAGGTSACSATCRITTGLACNAAAPGATGAASCASGLCDTTNFAAPGHCAQCITNAQCSGATPVCNTSTSRCVACNTAGANPCNAGTVCYTSGAMAGQCSPCTADAQCSGATPACNSATGGCVACTSGNSAGCTGATPVCNPATNACVACNASGASPCGAGTVCSTSGATAGRCVQCSTNSQCAGATPACDTSTGRCRACAVATQSADCPSSPSSACNSASGACVAPAVALTAPASGSAVGSGTPTFSGTATPGQVVTVTVDGATVGTATANAMGAWSLPWPTGRAALSNGMHSAAATITTGGGPTSSMTSFTVGCLANADCSGATPVCDTATRTCVGCLTSAQCSGTRPVCDAAARSCRACAVATQSTDCAAPSAACNSASGACVAPAVALTAPANGSATGMNTPTLRGTGTPGQTVNVTLDGAALGMALVDASGNWSLAWPAGRMALANGMHNASAALSAGGTSAMASSAFTVGCASNTDCSGAAPICTVATNTCRACGPAGAASPDCTASALAPFCSGSGATAGSCVATPPRITAPADGSRTTDTRPALRGTGPANATVQVLLDGAVVGTARTDAAGVFTFAPTSSLAPGMHTVAAANLVGSVAGPAGAANTFTVATCASSAECAGTSPLCDAVTHACRGCTASDCTGATPVCSTAGASAGMCVAAVPTVGEPTSGATTASQRPEFTGTGTPGAMVVIYIDGVESGRATVDSSGRWSFTPTRDLGVGGHDVSVAPVTPGGDGGTVGPMGPPVHFTVTPCSDSSDCSGGAPVCDPSTGLCRACDPSSPSDCADPRFPVCSTAGPTRGRCVEDAPLVVDPADGALLVARRPTIQGFAAPGSDVAVRIDGVEVGRTTVGVTPNWTVALTGDLALGPHTVEGAYVQPGGTLSAPGAANRFTIVACLADTDCTSGQQCDPSAHTCSGGASDGGTDAGADASSPAPDSALPAEDASAPAQDASVNEPSTPAASACGCRTPGRAPLGAQGPALALLLAALAAARRRR